MDFEVIDLSAELAKPTVAKAPTPEAIEAAKQEEYREEVAAKASEIKHKKLEQAVENAVNPPAVKDEMSVTPPGESAVIILGVVEGIGNMFLPGAYKKAIIPKEDRVLLELIVANPDGGMLPGKDEAAQYAALKKRDKWREAVRGIPFTDSERAYLEEPLSRVLAKRQISMSPELALLMAVGVVMASRVTPLLGS